MSLRPLDVHLAMLKSRRYTLACDVVSHCEERPDASNASEAIRELADVQRQIDEARALLPMVDQDGRPVQ